MPTIHQGTVQPIEIITAGFEELGAAVSRLDRNALKTFNASQAQRMQLLQAAAKEAPDQAHLVNRIFLPTLKAQSSIASAAASAATARRVRDSADLLETATHIVPLNGDAVANATTLTYDVISPFNGQPWRYLDIFAASSAAVGTRISAFSVASLDHVVTSNITYSTAVTNPGIDLAQFVGTNVQAANLPRYRWRPWGLKKSGVLRPEGKITTGISNRSGGSASWYVGLMVQASPCGEDTSMYSTERNGVYPRKSKQSIAFYKKLMKLSLFG